MYISGKNEKKTTKIFLAGLALGVVINTLAAYFLFYPVCKNISSEEASCQILKHIKGVSALHEKGHAIQLLGKCKDTNILIVRKGTDFTVRTQTQVK